MTPRVVHLVSTSHDLQTAYSLRALRISSAGVRTIGPGGDYAHMLWAVPGLRGRIDSFDLIHAWDETSLAAALLAGTTRVVFNVPAGFTRARGAGRVLRVAAIRRGVRFVCTSPAQHRACVAAGLPPERCHLVRPPLVELGSRRHDHAALRNELGLSPDDFVMLAPGESTRAADHERAVWTASILHVVDERYRVLLWGRGRRVNAAATLGHKLRQPKLVVVAGVRDRSLEFEELLSAADALLLTARGPVTTLPVALAMNAGVPVIAVPRPELADVLGDNVTAFMVASNAPRLIAQRVLDLRTDAEAGQQVETRAQEHARELFSPERFVEEMESVYRHTMAASRPSLAQAAELAGLNAR